MFFGGKKKKKGHKKKSTNLRKKRVTREERLRSQHNRKVFAFVIIILFIISGSYYGYHIGAVKRFKEYSYSEFMRISSNAGFKVDEILVSGRNEIDKDTLVEALTIKRNMPIFGLDIEGAKLELEKISWIKGVTISRILPNIVFVDLNERSPVALWQKEGKISLVDDEGIILKANNLDKWKKLPIVVGKNSKEQLKPLVTLLKAEPLIKNKIVSASRIGKRRWNFKLNNGILIKLPEEDVEFALRRLVTIDKEKSIFSKNIKVIDLRRPERMVVELAKEGKNMSLNNKGNKS